MKRADARPVVRVRFARELGWLEVYDPFDACWLAIPMREAPPIWRRWAFADKAARRGQDRRSA